MKQLCKLSMTLRIYGTMRCNSFYKHKPLLVCIENYNIRHFPVGINNNSKLFEPSFFIPHKFIICVTNIQHLSIGCIT